MENVLKTIAKQANLDRVLFTPALKKLYFDMAVGSGGALQFKHADSLRNGLKYASEQIVQNKKSLLFCATHELLSGYEMLIETAVEMKAVVILAVRSGLPESLRDHGSFLQFGDIGWLQFFTHTLQETYDHLALAYHLHAEKKLNLPVLIFHSSLSHQSLGTWVEKENINLGSPIAGWGKAPAKKMDFEQALAKLAQKKEKPTLSRIYADAREILREVYPVFGYDTAEGFPYSGDLADGKTAIVSVIPADQEEGVMGFCRPLCYRPFCPDGLTKKLAEKEVIAVVEPHPAPGVTVAPFFAQVAASLPRGYQGRIFSMTIPTDEVVLSGKRIQEIRKILETKAGPQDSEMQVRLS